MQDHMNIPSDILVGFTERTDTYTRKLGFITHKTPQGKIRKEQSWHNWKDSSIPVLDTKNAPTSGFVINRDVGGVKRSYGWNARIEKVRVHDPRGFEIEITVPNLLFILQECNAIKGKGLVGDFVYAWIGQQLVLLPTSSNEYISSIEYSKAQLSSVTKGDMVPGRTYANKDLEQLVYIGRVRHRTSFTLSDMTSQELPHHSHTFLVLTEGVTEYTNDMFKFYRGFDKISHVVDSTEHHDFANIRSALELSEYCNVVVKAKFRELDKPSVLEYATGKTHTKIMYTNVDGSDRFDAVRFSTYFSPTFISRAGMRGYDHAHASRGFVFDLTVPDVNADMDIKFDVGIHHHNPASHIYYDYRYSTYVEDPKVNDPNLRIYTVDFLFSNNTKAKLEEPLYYDK